MSKRSAVRLPVLESLRIASPCNASWDDMTGDERVRFCGSCKKNVYNLSAMPRAEAEALLEEREGSLCVRMFRRADGTVMTNDCPVGVRKKRVRRALFAAAGASAMAAAATAAFARMGRTMGEVEMAPMTGAVAVPFQPAETGKAVAAPVPTTMGSVAAPEMGEPAPHATVGVVGRIPRPRK